MDPEVLYAYWVFIVCILVFIVCILGVYCVYRVFVYWVFIVCVLGVYCVCIGCLLYAYWVFIVCILGVFCRPMHNGCLLCVH